MDHESATGHVVRAALGAHHDVVAVNCGKDGLDALRDGTSFDLVLCDLDLPDISGLEFWQHLRSFRPELMTRVVFTSCDDESDWTTRARATGARVMQKPIAAKELTALLAESPVAGSKTA